MPSKKEKQKKKAVKPEIKETKVKQATKTDVLKANVDIALETKEPPTTKAVVDDGFVIDESLFSVETPTKQGSTREKKKGSTKVIIPLMPSDKVISAMIGEFDGIYEINIAKGLTRKSAIQESALSIKDVHGLLPLIVPDDAEPKGKSKETLKETNPLDWKSQSVNLPYIRTRMKQLLITGDVFAIRKGSKVNYAPSLPLFPAIDIYKGSYLHIYQIKTELFDSDQWNKFSKDLKKFQTSANVFPVNVIDLDYFLSLPLATIRLFYVDGAWDKTAVNDVLSDFKAKLQSERLITLHGSVDNAIKEVTQLVARLTEEGKSSVFFNLVLVHLQNKKVEETST